jgi:hypothetical protein
MTAKDGAPLGNRNDNGQGWIQLALVEEGAEWVIVMKCRGAVEEDMVHYTSVGPIMTTLQSISGQFFNVHLSKLPGLFYYMAFTFSIT